MNRPKLTVTRSLGHCVARGVVSESGNKAITVIRPEDYDEAYLIPAASINIISDDAIRGLGELCRQLVPESAIRGLTLRETGGLYEDMTKELELDFRAPDDTHFAMIVPKPASPIVIAWWKAQQPK